RRSRRTGSGSRRSSCDGVPSGGVRGSVLGEGEFATQFGLAFGHGVAEGGHEVADGGGGLVPLLLYVLGDAARGEPVQQFLADLHEEDGEACSHEQPEEAAHARRPLSARRTPWLKAAVLISGLPSVAVNIVDRWAAF